MSVSDFGFEKCHFDSRCNYKPGEDGYCPRHSFLLDKLGEKLSHILEYDHSEEHND